ALPLLADTVQVADMNGDGKLDLVFGKQGQVAAFITLGNGDGTFQPYSVFTMPEFDDSWTAIGDLNHDGKPDLVGYGGEYFSKPASSGKNFISGPDALLNDNSSAVVHTTVTVIPANHAPVNHVPAAQLVHKDSPLQFSSAGGNAISIS